MLCPPTGPVLAVEAGFEEGKSVCALCWLLPEVQAEAAFTHAHVLREAEVPAEHHQAFHDLCYWVQYSCHSSAQAQRLQGPIARSVYQSDPSGALH